MKVELKPEFVAERIDDWLYTERRITYDGGHNNVLENYEKTRSSYLPDLEGEYSNKVNGHYDRFGPLMRFMSDEDEIMRLDEPYAIERFVAKVAHHAMMFVAGARRLECNARAQDQPSYYKLHMVRSLIPMEQEQNGSHTCVDLVAAVQQGLDFARGFEPGQEINQIRSSGVTVNKAIKKAFVEAQDALLKANAKPGIALRGDHRVVLKMHEVQHGAVAWTAAHFAVTTALREGAGHRLLVPVMQPDSITKVEDMELVDILSRTTPRYTFRQAQE